jgi:hypothetical protein
LIADPISDGFELAAVPVALESSTCDISAQPAHEAATHTANAICLIIDHSERMPQSAAQHPAGIISEHMTMRDVARLTR